MFNRKIFAIIPIVFLLSSCVIAVGGYDYDEEDGSYSTNGNSSNWKKIQNTNRHNMSKLVLGQNSEQVYSIMGKPDFTEAFTHENGKAYNILYYRTHREHGDGETTKDETTAVVLEENKLIGWGNDALQRIQ